MKKYTVRPKTIVSCHEALNQPEQKKAYCALSLWNRNFYGRRLTALLKYLDKNFTDSLLLTCGYLYRFNYMLSGYSEDEAVRLAQHEENEYIRNELQSLNHYPSIRLLKWSEITQSEAFKPSLAITKNFLLNHQDIQLNLRDFSRKYVSKKIADGSISVSKEKAIELSEQFLIEEAACFNMIINQGHAVDVYPGVVMPVLNEIIKGHYPDAPAGLKKRVSIEVVFNKKGTHRRF